MAQLSVFFLDSFFKYFLFLWEDFIATNCSTRPCACHSKLFSVTSLRYKSLSVHALLIIRELFFKIIYGDETERKLLFFTMFVFD